MANLSELREQQRKMEEEQKKLNKAIADAEAEELAKARRKVWDKIENMSEEEKDFILSHMEHSRTSCSDTHVANGLWSTEYDGAPGWRCPKCMLMEILRGDHGGKYDFQLSVDIFEVSV